MAFNVNTEKALRDSQQEPRYDEIFDKLEFVTCNGAVNRVRHRGLSNSK